MNWNSNIVFAGVLIPLLFASCKKDGTGTNATASDTTGLSYVVQPAGNTVLSSQRTFRIGQDSISGMVKLTGIIVPDERRTNVISARFSGRIEKLYVRLPDQYISRGQKLMEIYSAEISGAIGEHLLLFHLDSSAALVKNSRTRLLAMGVSDTQIKQAEASGKIPVLITIYSPYNGFLFNSDSKAEGVQDDDAGDGMQGMNPAIKPETAATPQTQLKEGGFIAEGQELFRLNDASQVFAVINLPDQRVDEFKAGDAVKITSDFAPGTISEGKVQLVEPVFEEGRKSLRMRIELNNSDGHFKFNSLVTLEHSTAAHVGFVVPASCVYDLGKRKIVWVRSRMIDSVGVFSPRIVATGFTGGSTIEILSGVSLGEEIATEAGLLTDREGAILTDRP